MVRPADWDLSGVEVLANLEHLPPVFRPSTLSPRGPGLLPAERSCRGPGGPALSCMRVPSARNAGALLNSPQAHRARRTRQLSTDGS